MIDRYSRKEMADIWSDESRYRRWLEVETAACDVRAELGLMPTEAAVRIRRNARIDTRRIQAVEARVKHDVIAFVSVVEESIGEDACYFHEGLTSSDILDTALAMQLRDAAGILDEDLSRLIEITAELAGTHKKTLMVGRTHGIHAEPITFGLKCAVWHLDLRRARHRLSLAAEDIRVGKLSGAVGQFAHLPPEVEERVMARLGLRPEPVATQVVHRDRHACFLNALALTAAAAEKIAVEIRHLQRTEVLELEEPFGKKQRGSSAMPHKRNPVLCENICGLARLVRSFAAPGMENIILWHERDISHSSVERIILPDGTITLDFLLHRLAFILSGLTVNTKRMLANLDATNGLIYSQRVLLALTGAGLPRNQAYELVQRNAMRVWREKGSFLDYLLRDSDVVSILSPARLRSLFDPRAFLVHADRLYRRAGLDEEPAAEQVPPEDSP